MGGIMNASWYLREIETRGEAPGLEVHCVSGRIDALRGFEAEVEYHLEREWEPQGDLMADDDGRIHLVMYRKAIESFPAHLREAARERRSTNVKLWKDIGYQFMVIASSSLDDVTRQIQEILETADLSDVRIVGNLSYQQGSFWQAFSKRLYCVDVE